jgi:hypothetical protein
MSSSLHTPSLSARSTRSSFIQRLVPRGFHLAPDQSDTNSMTTSIQRPGRIIGSLLSRAGRRFGVAVDRFAEEQLGIGPHTAVLRLTSALHDIHMRESPGCRSDHKSNINASFHTTDQLIWVCNGYCSQCFTAYLPQVLIELPEPAFKAIQQLIAYLRYVHFIIVIHCLI